MWAGSELSVTVPGPGASGWIWRPATVVRETTRERCPQEARSSLEPPPVFLLLLPSPSSSGHQTPKPQACCLIIRVAATATSIAA